MNFQACWLDNKTIITLDEYTKYFDNVCNEIFSGNINRAADMIEKLDGVTEISETLILALPSDNIEYVINQHPITKAALNKIREKYLTIKKRFGYCRYVNNEIYSINFKQLSREYLYNYKVSGISKNAKVVAFGSCFATNIVHRLQQNGIDAYTIEQVEDFNNPMLNQALMSLDYNLENGSHWRISSNTALAESCRLHDMQVKETETIAKKFGSLKERIKSAGLAIITIGTALAFLDMNGAIMLSRPNSSTKSSLLTLDDIQAALTSIRGVINSLNPAINVVFTLSPIPIWAKYHKDLGGSAVEIDCVSKSINRLALFHYFQNLSCKKTFYFPSFELVRWIAPSIRNLDIWTDGRHLHKAGVVDVITDLFVEKTFRN